MIVESWIDKKFEIKIKVLAFHNALTINTMALNNVNIALYSLIEETKLATIDKIIDRTINKMVAFISDKIEVDEDNMHNMLQEFKESFKAEAKAEVKAEVKAEAKANVKAEAKAKLKKMNKSSDDDSSDEKKKTRVPSVYNLYIRDKIAELKAAGRKGGLMMLAIEAWNTDKATGKLGKTGCDEPKPESGKM